MVSLSISSSSSKFSSKFFVSTSLGLSSEMGRFTQRERCNLALGLLGRMGKATAPFPRKWWARPVKIGHDQTPAFKQTLPVTTSWGGQQYSCLCYGVDVFPPLCDTAQFPGELRERPSGLCLHNKMSMFCAITQWHISGSSRKELGSSLRKLQLLWHGVVTCLESAGARTVQHASKAEPGIVDCASSYVCGKDKGGFWSEHTPSA